MAESECKTTGTDAEGKTCGPLCACSMGLAAGMLWAAGLLLVGLVAMHTKTWGHQFITTFGSVYWGFKATLAGAFIGAGWGLLDGFIGGLVLFGLYNLFSRCGCRCCRRPKESGK